MAGCSGDGAEEASTTAPERTEPATTAETEPAPTTTEPEPTTVAMVAMPAGAAPICARLDVLEPLCPAEVPEARYGLAGPPIGHGGPYADGGYAICLRRSEGVCLTAVFHLEGGIPTDNPRRDRPPAFVHLALYASLGGLDRHFDFELPCTGPNVRDRANRLLTERRDTAACLGRTTLAGRRGTLALAPPFPQGGDAGGHLLFLWEEEGVSYAATLHAWRPVEKAVRVLDEVMATAP